MKSTKRMSVVANAKLAHTISMSRCSFRILLLSVFGGLVEGGAHLRVLYPPAIYFF
jgi:hypothetical protein